MLLLIIFLIDFHRFLFFADQQTFGQVYDVEIPLKNGQSRGYGFVTFEKFALISIGEQKIEKKLI